MLAVPPYVLLTGASPSILRAGLMALLGLAAARAGKLKDGLHLLAASAVLLLLWEPRLIESVSFQLSYIVTAGLILGVPAAQRVWPRPRGRSRFVYDAVVVTIVAQAASFPVTIFYFNQLHLLSLPANLLLVPFISFLIMPAGAAAMLLDPLWPGLAQWIASASAVGNEWTFRLISGMGGWRPGATVWATPPLWWIGAYYGAAFGLLLGLARWKALRQNEAAAAAEAGEDDTQPLGVLATAAPASGLRWRTRPANASPRGCSRLCAKPLAPSPLARSSGRSGSGAAPPAAACRPSGLERALRDRVLSERRPRRFDPDPHRFGQNDADRRRRDDLISKGSLARKARSI